jgi:hypothetical protein
MVSCVPTLLAARLPRRYPAVGKGASGNTARAFGRPVQVLKVGDTDVALSTARKAVASLLENLATLLHNVDFGKRGTSSIVPLEIDGYLNVSQATAATLLVVMQLFLASLD